MLNLLIVDDEPYIVEGLAILDWKDAKINKVYKATSGQEALKVMQENKIDIVISDIRMPDMSGLELIEKLSTKGNQMKYILLSGYAEFEYAQQAIHLSVCEYLLKPVSDSEIMDAVSRAVESIKKDQNVYYEMMDMISGTNNIEHIEPFEILYENPQLIQLFDGDRWGDARDKIDNIFNQLEMESFHFHEFIIQAYFMIGNTFTYFSHKNGHFLIDVIGSKFNRMHHAAYSGSITNLRTVTFEVFDDLKRSFKREVCSNHHTVIDQVNQYVEINLDRDISLQEVAENVYLHPAYLSKLYKATTGKSFSEFLYECKMNKAGKRLKQTNDKIYEISQTVGYKDPSYFIRKFKEYYGVTPQEYRSNGDFI